jgi:hypothetical protein
MRTKARLLFIIAAAVMLLGAGQMLSAGVTVTVASSDSIAPSSIPVPETGDPNIVVGMNRVKLTSAGSGVTSLGGIRVQLISAGGFVATAIQSIRVWFEPVGGNGFFDNGTAIDDVNALSGGPYSFTSNPMSITLETGNTGIRAGEIVYVYVGIELTSAAVASGVTIGVQTIEITEGGKALPVTGHGVQKPLDTYGVSSTTTGIAPGIGYTYQGESAQILKLAFTPADSDVSTKIRLGSVKVHSVGSPWLGGDSNLNTGGVVLYEDSIVNGLYDPGSDMQIASATLTSGYATLSPGTPATIPSTGKSFFIVVNVSLSGRVDDVVKLQVDNPSADIGFADAYADDSAPGSPDSAYVPYGRAYVQKGRIASTTATPSSGNQTTIYLQTTPQRPIVTSIVPGNSASNVSRSTTVVATFSKDMDGSTITSDYFKLFDGATEIPGSVAFDGTITATFTPSSPLSWGTTYTARVLSNGTDSGVRDVGLPPPNRYMNGNKEWSFTTAFAVNPTVLSTSPLNAQIEIPRTATVTATFSKPMDSATINVSTFTLFDGTSYVTGTVDYDAPSRTATFTQTSPPLAWGRVYTASISTGATDTDDLALQSAHTWTFTTSAPVYPLVAVTTPANGESEVSRTGSLTATFSKDMDPFTVDASTFTLEDHLGGSVTASSVSYDSGSVTATFDPLPAELAWGETYTARVTTGAKDASGLPLLSDKVWTFTTTMPVNPTVTLTSPANGDNEVLRTSAVSATFSKSMAAVSLNDPATTFQVFIDDSLPANGIYDLGTDTLVAGTVAYDDGTKTATFTQSSPPLVWGQKYTARISTAATAADGLALPSAKVWTFTTTMPVYPTVTLTSPANGDNEVLRTTTVSAVFSKSMSAVTLNSPATTFQVFLDANTNGFYDGGDTLIGGTVAYDDGTKTATFTQSSPPLPWGTKYTARISTAAAATDGLILQSAKVWTFTTTMPVYPTIEVRSPAHGTLEVDPGENVTAFFSKDMDGTSVTNATFIVFKDVGGVPYHYDAGTDALVGASVTLAPARLATLNPTVNLDWGTQYTVNVTDEVKDTDGLTMPSTSFWYFTTKIPVYPVVSSTSPAPDVTGVLPGAVVTATFSKNMGAATINAATFTLTDDVGAPVPGNVTFNGTTGATFTPTTPLTPGKKYTATIHGDGATEVRAEDGLYMLADRTWSFWTSTRPAVLSYNPANAAVGVSRAATVKIVFSKNIDPDTLTSTSLVLRHSTGAQVSGSIAYDSGTYTATFTPVSELAYAAYTATVGSGASGVKDGNGIEMATDITWSFSTVPDLQEPVAANNRIVPGSSAPVTIFIPQPPAGAGDRVTVQVFTTTGKRVATLVNAKPYSELLADLPLLWDGANGRAEKLGPGLYFIRISATGWTRTLKVMIVR